MIFRLLLCLIFFYDGFPLLVGEFPALSLPPFLTEGMERAGSVCNYNRCEESEAQSSRHGNGIQRLLPRIRGGTVCSAAQLTSNRHL